MTCKCYHAEKNFIGKIGVCWGTKETEACSCGGDESKCDFYEEVRERASLSQKLLTNADRIRAMTDEELAELLTKTDMCELLCGPAPTYCKSRCEEKCMEWLKKEGEA